MKDNSNKDNELILFETEDRAVTLSVPVNQEMVWLSRNQMAELFDRDIKTIDKHINNALSEELDNQEVVAKFATTSKHGAIEGKTQTHMTDFITLMLLFLSDIVLNLSVVWNFVSGQILF